MDYGVTITRGAAPWQIFQQGPDGTACIRLEGKYHLVHLSQELPLQFSAVPHAKTTAAIAAITKYLSFFILLAFSVLYDPPCGHIFYYFAAKVIKNSITK